MKKWDMSKCMKGALLKKLVRNIPDDIDVSFGPAHGNQLGSLSIHRFKQRGPNLVNVEFNEVFEVIDDPTPEQKRKKRGNGKNA